MTEAQWLASTNPREMYTHLLLAGREPSNREKEAYIEACREHAAQANPHRCWRWGTFDSWLEGVVWASILSPATRASILSPATRAHYLRDIVGNPFRPWLCQRCARGPASLVLADAGVAFACRGCADKHYRVPLEIRSLAHAAYYGRDVVTDRLDPARLAVLADALEEAGCDNADLLSHLHSPGPHVKGCWALRLVYGRP